MTSVRINSDAIQPKLKTSAAYGLNKEKKSMISTKREYRNAVIVSLTKKRSMKEVLLVHRIQLIQRMERRAFLQRE
jgi:hypothetical protein